jgi:hypothetical protein
MACEADKGVNKSERSSDLVKGFSQIEALFASRYSASRKKKERSTEENQRKRTFRDDCICAPVKDIQRRFSLSFFLRVLTRSLYIF